MNDIRDETSSNHETEWVSRGSSDKKYKPQFNNLNHKNLGLRQETNLNSMSFDSSQ